MILLHPSVMQTQPLNQLRPQLSKSRAQLSRDRLLVFRGLPVDVPHTPSRVTKVDRIEFVHKEERSKAVGPHCSHPKPHLNLRKPVIPVGARMGEHVLTNRFLYHTDVTLYLTVGAGITPSSLSHGHTKESTKLQCLTLELLPSVGTEPARFTETRQDASVQRLCHLG